MKSTHAKPVQGDLFHQENPQPAQSLNSIFSKAAWPYIHSGSNTKTLALVWLAALVPAFALYIYSNTAQLTVALSTVAGSILAKVLWRKLNVVENDRSFVHALYNGLLASMLLPADTPWWLAIAGMIIAVSITNATFYKFHARLINPSLLLAAILSMIYPSSFVSMPIASMPVLVALSAGALFLAISKAATLLPSVIVIATLAWSFPATTLNVAAALFLVPDYDGSPLMLRPKILQALIVLLLALGLSLWAHLAAALLVSLLASSLITPLLDRINA
jgi:electron transport complex protein RnfD